MTPSLHLHTLGNPELRLRSPQIGDVVVPAVQQKHLAVLTYIALSPDRRASRRVLASLLWGETEDSDDRHGLRSSLSLLRNPRALGPAALSSGDRETISLVAPVWTDCLEFERLVASGEYEAAVALYQGKFFQDWALPGCEGFEDWAAGRRSHYSALFCSAAREVCTKLTDAGRAPAAVALAERVRDENPLDPAQWRMLIETRIAARDFVRAAADADTVERMADSEGIALDKTMKAILRRARDREWSAGTEQPSEEARLQTPQMVGREKEFASLLRSWDRAAAGRFVQVQVIAGPGLGKSRLSLELAARLHARRVRVVVVRGDLVLKGVAHGLVARLAHALAKLPGALSLTPSTASVLVGLDPSLGDVYRQAIPTFPPPLDAPRLHASALRDLLTAVSAERPIAILLDDLHWTDAPSLHVLAAAVAQIESAPVLLVSSARPGMLGGPLPTSKLELQPLPLDAVHEMIRSLAGFTEQPWCDAFVEHVHRVSLGSPFLVLQTLASALDQGLISIENQSWECGDLGAFVGSVTGNAIVGARVAELSEAERFALIVVGFGAGFLSADRVNSAVQGRLPASESLDRLERRGLVDSVRGALRVTHDEIFDAATAASTRGEIALARRAVAHALDERTSLDSDRLRQIGMHLVEAGAVDEVPAVFTRYVQAHRNVGDRRSLMDLAHDFRGPVPDREARALVASLPRGLRGGRFSSAWAFVGVLGTAAAIALVALRPDAQAARLLVTLADSTNAPSTWTARLREDQWTPELPIRLAGGRSQATSVKVAELRPQRPTHRSWAVQYESNDSGGVEVGLLAADGTLRRITESVGEDTPFGWSPDGRFLLIGTTRWSDDRHLNTAVYDMENGNLRRLTGGPGSETSASWSPDGGRIAFVRRSYGRQASALCWTTPESSSERCVALSGLAPQELSGWLSPARVLLQADSSGVQSLYVVELDSLKYLRTATPPGIGPCSASADQVWLACPPFVTRLSQVERWRRVDSKADAVQGMHWDAHGTSRWLIDSLTIESSTDTVPIDVPFRLRVSVFALAGVTQRHAALTWHSADSSIATVDSLGTVRGGRRGRVAITASIGGWRSQRREFVIAERSAATRTSVDWDRDTSEWVRFGEPSPLVQRASFGRALNVNGDGQYFSGAYSAFTLQTAGGVGFEATLSTPITRMQWQYLQLGVMPIDTKRSLAFTGESSFLPGLGASAACVMAFPRAEGTDDVRGVGVNGVFAEDLPGPSDNPFPAVADGRPWRARVQLLPDGRCGLAINDKPVALSPMAGTLRPRVHLILQGHSVGTRILVGNLRYWTGVPTDIDWNRIVRLRDVPGLSGPERR